VKLLTTHGLGGGAPVLQPQLPAVERRLGPRPPLELTGSRRDAARMLVAWRSDARLVEATQLDSGDHQLGLVGLVDHVAGDGAHGRQRGQLPGGRLQGLRIPPVDDEVPPVPGQVPGQCQAQAPGGSGDQCCGVVAHARKLRTPSSHAIGPETGSA